MKVLVFSTLNHSLLVYRVMGVS